MRVEAAILEPGEIEASGRHGSTRRLPARTCQEKGARHRAHESIGGSLSRKRENLTAVMGPFTPEEGRSERVRAGPRVGKRAEVAPP